MHTFIDQYTKYPVVDVCTSTNWEQMEPMLETALGMLGNVESVTSDNGPPYNSGNFRKFAKQMGFKHRKCTPENPQANGLVEVFQKVLVKLVHTATIEKRDPKKVVQAYLRAYRAAPQKTTGVSPYEAMFGRKMITKLPGFGQQAGSDLDRNLREKATKEKEKQKRYVDKKRKVTAKEVKPGDQVLFKRNKSTIKSPWDPEPYQVVEVEGSKVTATRGAEKKARAKNHIKVVQKRPPHLRLKGRQRVVKEDELDLEVSQATIDRMCEQVVPGVAPGEEVQIPPALVVPPGLEEEAATQIRDRSISAAGRIRRAPVRFGFEEERDAYVNEEEELMVSSLDSTVREVTPETSPWVSPESSLLVASENSDREFRLPVLPGRVLSLAQMEYIDPTWGGIDEPEILEVKEGVTDHVARTNLSPRQRKRLKSAAKFGKEF